jgi:hypothetical protein
MAKCEQRLEWLVIAASMAAIAFCVIALVMMLAGCGAIKSAGGEVGGNVAEVVACPINLVNCGHVYLCEQSADNALEHVEICVDDDDELAGAELLYGLCEPTPRHQGLCISCCGSDCGGGCNAFTGCYCPAP